MQVVPHNIEAEQALLGAIFIDPQLLAELAPVVKPEMFYRASHQHIYDAMMQVSGRGQDVDWVQVEAEVAKQGKTGACGGSDVLKAYLVEVSNALPSAYGARGYAEIVRERWTRREAIHTCSALAALLHADGADARAEMAKAARNLADIAAGHSNQDPKNIESFVGEAQEASLAGGVGGIMAPWEELNRITTGWKPGQLIVVAAATGVGKSAFAAAIANHNLESGALLFSLEMMGREVASRIICMRAGIDSRRYDTGKLSEQERVQADFEARELRGNFWIDDSASMDVAALRAKSLRWRAKHEISLIIVDYLGLVDEKISGGKRVEIVGAISRGLKLLAMECRLPVIALHQLNRDAAKEKREPQLHDLRDSGNVEQDANQVILLHKESSDEDTGVDVVKCRVAKNRGGPLSSILLNFRRKCTRFESVAGKPPNFNVRV
jgi:replicative DNA helicase